MHMLLSKHLGNLMFAAVLLLLLTELAMQVHLARTDSQTTDEAVHLSAGYTYLTRGDLRFNPEHPPLVKMIAALPLVLIHPHDPASSMLWDRAANFFYDSWRENRAYGGDFLYNADNNADRLLFAARLPIVFLSVLLGLIIFLISRSLFGAGAGLLSLALYTFDPTVIAHGHLVTTDIAASLGFLSSLWMLWRYISKPSWKRLTQLAIVMATTMLFKFTMIILLPILVSCLVWLFLNVKKHHVSGTTLFSHLVIGVLMVWGIIIAVYGFDFRSAPASASITHAIVANVDVQYAHLADTVQASKADRVYSALHAVMIPRYYFKGLVMILTHVTNGHGTFLLGNISRTGWWYYFPFLLLAKLPPTTLLIFVLLGLTLVRRKKPDAVLFLTICAMVFLVFAMLSKANLGIRHVLPILPPLYVSAGVLIQASKRVWLAALACAIITIMTVSMAYPFELGYFNSLFGGSRNGVNIATDSNSDWGQDLKRIKMYVDKNAITNAMIIYPWDGQEAFDFYHIAQNPYHRLMGSESGTIIIGATFLHHPEYDWLLAYPPHDYISPGVLVYTFGSHR